MNTLMMRKKVNARVNRYVGCPVLFVGISQGGWLMVPAFFTQTARP
jgi:hypothetical protein